MDIVQNSLTAGANEVFVHVTENMETDLLTIMVEDNGRGMDKETVVKVSDPYYTTRTTRKVGLGIPLLKQHAEMAGGKLVLDSEPGKGTKLEATFLHSHVDRQELGDLAGVMVILVGANPNIRFVYKHRVNESEVVFDTTEVEEVLDGVPINEPGVLKYLREMIGEQLAELTENQKPIL